jgi:16S rRNA (adenine1518-N6/adenine1519-N6)-dimethyltransferase
MTDVRPKKHLGQHFLNDEEICQKIVDALIGHGGYKTVVEVGPGVGAITKYLVQKPYNFSVVEIDQESVAYLKQHFPSLKIYSEDFLRMDFRPISNGESMAIIGNFPYNISSQILFKVYDERHLVTECVGMFQKEVAERIASKPGSKVYGILSVLIQAFYDVEYLFTVDEHVFNPPPKVKSGVIRLKRNSVEQLPCDEKLFKTVVKLGFNQRRKTLRNSLKPLLNERNVDASNDIFNLRPEQLSVEQFVEITKMMEVGQIN